MCQKNAKINLQPEIGWNTYQNCSYVFACTFDLFKVAILDFIDFWSDVVKPMNAWKYNRQQNHNDTDIQKNKVSFKHGQTIEAYAFCLRGFWVV